MFSKISPREYTGSLSAEISGLKAMLAEADAVIIGAGAGLSASAGMYYNGARFERYFGGFAEKYGISDMYAGGFYPFPSLEEYWGWWSRNIWINRYEDPPKQVYGSLQKITAGRECFVITTNVDHQFQRVGFDKERLFYTQGDYGLFQCSVPCHRKTYDNENTVRKMLEAQGLTITAAGDIEPQENIKPALSIPTELVPHCPVCGEPMTVNLRADNTFVEDEGWYAASERYSLFLQAHRNAAVLYLELGVGANTPSIIKYPFWRLTAENENARYVCLNKGQAYIPTEIAGRSLSVDADIGEIIERISAKQ